MKIFFASLLSLIAFTILAVVILVWMISAAASSDKVKVGDNAVLVLDLETAFREQEVDNTFGMLTGEGEGDIPGLFDVLRLLKHAKTDGNIKGLYIKCNNNNNGFATSEALRNAIIDFKSSGKFTIAYGEVVSQKSYYVAAAADKLYCNPKGSVEWNGLATTLFFVKGTLEKLNIEPQIFYAGKFKSATEPLREYQMTEANKLQTAVYLNELYSTILMSAADKSKKDTATLHQLANEGTIQTAYDALRYNLIDAVKYDDEIKSEIINNLKIDERTKINFVSLEKYNKAASLQESSSNRIAVIYAEGEIVGSQGNGVQISSDEYKNLIRKVRLDKSVKAIVVRVNSPGGSALASEVIWRELALAKKAKPVVVSFGDYAASGGYYISCNADFIFAQSNTITGSIGVFGIIPNMGPFFKTKLGVTFDGVKTGPFADMPNISRPLTAAEKRFVQNSIDTIYNDFKQRVASGRNKPVAFVDSIAQGRVWTGQHAITIGLVDKLGGMQEAINCAARMASLKDFRLKEYPEKKNLLERLVKDYSSDVKTSMIKKEVGEEQYEIFTRLKTLKSMIAVPQTRLPFDIVIQ